MKPRVSQLDQSGAADGDVLTWDDTAGKWVAAAPTGGGGGSGTPVSVNAAKLLTVTVTAPLGGTVPTNLFNGNTNTTDYVDVGTGTRELVIDLGVAIDINTVRLWMYYGDSRTFTNVGLEGSNDGSTWTSIRSPANWQPSSTSGHLDITVGASYRYLRTHSEANSSFNSNEYVEVEVYADVLFA